MEEDHFDMRMALYNPKSISSIRGCDKQPLEQRIEVY